MIEIIKRFRKEVDEDKEYLKSSKIPKEMKEAAKYQIDRLENHVVMMETQNDMLHVMGTVITNCSTIIDSKPEVVKEILLDAIERMKEIKKLIKNKI